MADAEFAARSLTVRGSGRASAPADNAEVILGVEAVRPTATEARAVAAGTMSGVVDALRGLGIEDRNIRTTDLSLGPEIEYRQDGTARRTGFRLTNRVTIRVDNPAMVAEVVDAVITAGATSLDGVAFRAEHPDAARRAALSAAVADARAAADELARAAGVRLGSVQAIRAGDGGGPRPVARLALMEAQAVDTPVMPGSSDIEATVEVTWALEGEPDQAAN